MNTFGSFFTQILQHPVKEVIVQPQTKKQRLDVDCKQSRVVLPQPTPQIRTHKLQIASGQQKILQPTSIQQFQLQPQKSGQVNQLVTLGQIPSDNVQQVQKYTFHCYSPWTTSLSNIHCNKKNYIQSNNHFVTTQYMFHHERPYFLTSSDGYCFIQVLLQTQLIQPESQVATTAVVYSTTPSTSTHTATPIHTLVNTPNGTILATGLINFNNIITNISYIIL